MAVETRASPTAPALRSVKHVTLMVAPTGPATTNRLRYFAGVRIGSQSAPLGSCC
jgi:hypothetical protein